MKDLAATNDGTSFNAPQPARESVVLPWKPILDGSAAQHAIGLIRTIADVHLSTEFGAPDLGNGSPGISLFLAYHSALAETIPWRVPAASILCRAAYDAQTAPFPQSFLNGLSGVAWAIDHLRQEFDLHVDCEPGPTVTRLLDDRLSQTPCREVYELAHGLVGYGVYAAEQLDVPGRRGVLENVIDRLAGLALPSSHGGVTWWTAPKNLGEEQRTEAPRGHFNLGLAHGVPSVIAILAYACKLGVREEKARALLDRAMTWLRAQRQPDNAGSCFGTIFPLGARPSPRASRIAWCFGDLGLSAALYWAARNIGDENMAEEALDIARKTARRPPETSRVTEASICHGAAGNAHIFNRFYQATRDELFRDTARYWLERTFAYHDNSDEPKDVPVTKKRDGSMARTWPEKPGIFGGLSGIGLALLGAVTSREPAWDRMLLISMPPRPTVVCSRL